MAELRLSGHYARFPSPWPGPASPGPGPAGRPSAPGLVHPADESYGPRVQLRVARQTGRLDEVVAFYRDGLGLPEVARFVDHAGYSGVMLDVPGTAAHLEFTATEHQAVPTAHVEDLLVFYLGDQDRVDRVLARLGASPVPSANPYWDAVGVTVCDPDGFRVVLVAARWAP